jgi:aminomethyltransferase
MAKFGAFGDWEVPLYYSSILLEHEAVRTRAGIFDISHMGEFTVRGAGAEAFLEGLLPRRVAGMPEGKALYMPLLHAEGGIVDDVILYRLGPERFCFIVNAANTAKDWRWLREKAPARAVELENISDATGLLALQGPRSAAIAAKVFGEEWVLLSNYHARPRGAGMIARTGYTGEDGFEIMLPGGELLSVWQRLFEAGEPEGLVPAGFGARDTLRLEAGMPLYGHDLSDDVSPLEAGLDWTVDLNKPAFIGREALLRQADGGPKRRLAGFEMLDRGIPRQGQVIRWQGQAAGAVTSGSYAPTLKKNIGLGFVPAAAAQTGSEIEIVVRDRPLKARIVKTPFYRRVRRAND